MPDATRSALNLKTLEKGNDQHLYLSLVRCRRGISPAVAISARVPQLLHTSHPALVVALTLCFRQEISPALVHQDLSTSASTRSRVPPVALDDISMFFYVYPLAVNRDAIPVSWLPLSLKGVQAIIEGRSNIPQVRGIGL